MKLQFSLTSDFLPLENPPLFASPEWLDALCEAYGLSWKYALARQDGTPLLYMPVLIRKIAGFDLTTIPSLVFYTPLVSLDKNGLRTAEEPGVSLVSGLAQMLLSRLVRSDVRCTPGMTDIRGFQWQGYRTDIRYTYLIDLAQPPHLRHSMRKRNRKLLHRGAIIRRIDDPRLCVRMLRETFRNQQGELPVSEAVLERWIRRLVDVSLARQYILEVDGRIAGIKTVLCDRDTECAWTWVGATHPDFRKEGASAMLMALLLQTLGDEGYKTCDLLGANIERFALFKAGFGGKLTPFYTALGYQRSAAGKAAGLLSRLKRIWGER